MPSVAPIGMAIRPKLTKDRIPMIEFDFQSERASDWSMTNASSRVCQYVLMFSIVAIVSNWPEGSGENSGFQFRPERRDSWRDDLLSFSV